MGGSSKDRNPDSPDDGREEDAPLPIAEDPLVVLPIEDSLDLHTFSPKELAPLVEEYLHQCQLREFREVRIIHGRGTGTQRTIVRSLLAKHPFRGRIQRRVARFWWVGRYRGKPEAKGSLMPLGVEKVQAEHARGRVRRRERF